MSLLNGINSSRRCINEHSMFFLIVRHHRRCRPHRRRPCRRLTSSAAWEVSPVGHRVPAYFLPHFTGSVLHFTNILRTAHLDHCLPALLLLALLRRTRQSAAAFEGCRRWVNYVRLSAFFMTSLTAEVFSVKFRIYRHAHARVASCCSRWWPASYSEPGWQTAGTAAGWTSRPATLLSRTSVAKPQSRWPIFISVGHSAAALS